MLVPGIIAIMALSLPHSARGATVEAITFAAVPDELFLPVYEAAQRVGWPLRWNEEGRLVELNRKSVQPGSLRRFTNGAELIGLEQMAAAGAAVVRRSDGSVRVASGFRAFTVVAGAQSVEISLAKQQLYAWQGRRLVLQTRISSGRNNRTPAGEFRAGPYRAKMHRSSLYDDAKMPWSVQINGNIFVHGFSSVPNYPASHGCIRMPLNEGNPARFFYEWVLNGTPVQVTKN